MGAHSLEVRHHAFLQALMNRGPLSETEAAKMFKDLAAASNSGEDFVSFICDVNRELEFLQLEVKKVTNQYDGKQFYGLINTLPSKESKLGTVYSQAQLLFFTAVVEAIASDPMARGFIGSSEALYVQIAPEGESQSAAWWLGSRTQHIKLSMQAKEEALNLLEADRYLSRSDTGMVGLGVKSLLELRTFFRNLGVPFCAVCNEAAVLAQLCNSEGCSTRIHPYCLSRQSQARKQRPKCRDCGAEWAESSDDRGVDAEANVAGIGSREAGQNSGKRKKHKNRENAARADDGADAHTQAKGAEDDWPRTSSIQMRGKRRRALGHEDDDEHVDGNGVSAASTPRMSVPTPERKPRREIVEEDAEDEDVPLPSKSARRKRRTADV